MPSGLHTRPCHALLVIVRCNIYISRLFYDVSIRLSVHLSVTFVHCGHRVHGSWISLHAWIDGCLCYLLTTPHPDGMMPEFLVEEGGREKLVIVAISLIYLLESGLETRESFVYINDVGIFIIVRVEEFSLVISVENALYLKNSLC